MAPAGADGCLAGVCERWNDRPTGAGGVPSVEPRPKGAREPANQRDCAVRRKLPGFAKCLGEFASRGGDVGSLGCMSALVLSAGRMSRRP